MASNRRRLSFALVTFALLAGAVEGGAWLYERNTWVAERAYPVAGPGQHLDFNKAAEENRRQLNQGGTALVSDPRMKWGLQPNSVTSSPRATFRVNALGLRGPELQAKADGELRIMSLGDSSIYGDGVREQDVFVVVAADLLEHTWERPVTGVIGGVPGHDTTQSMALLAKVGRRVKPDWVVVGNLWSDIFHDKGRQLTVEGRADTISGPLRGLATYRVLRRLLAPWLLSQEVGFLSSKDDVGTLDGERSSRVLLKEYIENLAALTQQIEALGARPAFLILPAPMDLDPVPPPEAVLAYREAMRQAAAAADAPLVDGPALFLERGVDIGYWTDQVHPDRPGHLLLGEGLFDAMKDRGP
jgi:lysophospholipase L1-like esterase